MPKGLQVYILKKIFGDLDNFTFEDFVDEDLTLPENLWNLNANHRDEILNARHKAGYKEEDDARAFGWDDYATSQEEIWKEMQKHACELEKDETDFSEDEIEPQEEKGWQIEQTENGEIHSVEVEIEPHRIKAKGKQYIYGRIQHLVTPEWIGLKSIESVFLYQLRAKRLDFPTSRDSLFLILTVE